MAPVTGNGEDFRVELKKEENMARDEQEPQRMQPPAVEISKHGGCEEFLTSEVRYQLIDCFACGQPTFGTRT
jgi:hypothetical protein